MLGARTRGVQCGVGNAGQSGWPTICTDPVAFTLLIPWSAQPFVAHPEKLDISSLFVEWSQPESNRRPPACKVDVGAVSARLEHPTGRIAHPSSRYVRCSDNERPSLVN